jgi:hypothetical protein
MSDLLKINVNEHTEKKGGLTYLSWAWAWAEVLKVDPQATWNHMDFTAGADGMTLLAKMDDGTALVGVEVVIKGICRSCTLPVMDNRNKAIANPNAFDVNKAQMRCLAKAIAMHGLGLYIYAGEDLPEGEESDSLVPALEASIEQAKQKRHGVMGAVLDNIDVDNKTKTALAKLAFHVGEAFKHPTEGASLAYDRVELEELNNDEKLYLWSLLDSKLRSALKREQSIRSMKHNQPETA